MSGLFIMNCTIRECYSASLKRVCILEYNSHDLIERALQRLEILDVIERRCNKDGPIIMIFTNNKTPSQIFQRR